MKPAFGVYLKKYTTVSLLLSLSIGVAEAQNFYSGQAARAVIGQSTFSAGISNAQAYILGGASGVAVGGGYIWIADSNNLGYTPSNNRVMLFGTAEIPSPRADLSKFSTGDSLCNLCGFAALNVLGQADYKSTNPGRGTSATPGTSGSGYMNNPTGVATDGTILAVADTNNNRILIWNSLPLASMSIPPDLVLGQTNFTNGTATATQSGLSGPVGVWIQNGKLFVADTANSRVLIWNSIPTSNNQPADLVLGEPDFTTVQCPNNQNNCSPVAAANRMYNPTSVTSDGTRLFVADEGFSRILIWNSIPTTNDQSPDLVLGQPDFVSQTPNNSNLCGGGPLCAADLNLPEFALSDGTRLYVSDTGNDRVLIYNTIPTSNSPNADVVLGQPNFTTDIVTSQTISITSTVIDNTGAVDVIPSPTALAWDGTNLYVADPANRRVLLFNPGDTQLPEYSVVNAASGPDFIRQEGIVTIFLVAGVSKPVANDTVSITIGSNTYTYTIKSSDTLDTIAQGLVNVINSSNSGAGDPDATALFAGAGTASVYLSSKAANPGYDTIALSTTSSNTSNEAPIASGSYLTSGTAATGASGMLAEIDGTDLSDITTTDPVQINASGVQVYMNGFTTNLVSVSPSTILAQVPLFITNGTAPSGDTSSESQTDQNSISVYVRTVHLASGNNVTITNATPLYIAPANPGLFDAAAFPGEQRPWPASQAYHQSGNPNVVIDVDGTVHAGDVGTITIAGKAYNYTVVSTDTLSSIQTNLINLINNAPDPNVTASAGAAFNRIVLTAKQSGAAGTGISVTATVSSSAQLTLTAYSSATCCDVTPNSQITPANPAAPGELITVYATGLGVLSSGTAANTVTATMGGSDAEVVSAGYAPNQTSIYAIQLIVPTSLSANQYTQLYVAQNAFISNIVTIPVGTAVQAAPPGTGIAEATVLVSPPTMVFANQNLFESSTTQTITVYNPSSASAQLLGAIQLTGANAGAFTISSNTCPAAGTALAAEGTCNINITYNTGGTGTNSATLTVYDGVGLAHNVALLGYDIPSFDIMNRLSGLVLDVTGLSTSDGAVIQQWSYLSGANQQWTFAALDNGAFNIVNVNSGLVLDVTARSTLDAALIQQWSSLGTTNQQWNLLPYNGYVKIQNVNSGKVLDVTGESTSDGAQIQQWDNWADPGNQQWTISPVQYYEIVNVNSGKVLDVQGVSALDGAAIQQWDYLGGANQQWQIIPVPGSSFYFSILNRNSGKVLDVIDQSTEAGALIQQYDSLQRSNQEWAFLATSVPNAYAIVNLASGRVLDVIEASTADGTLIQQYDYLGTPNQMWMLVPVGVP